MERYVNIFCISHRSARALSKKFINCCLQKESVVTKLDCLKHTFSIRIMLQCILLTYSYVIIVIYYGEITSMHIHLSKHRFHLKLLEVKNQDSSVDY